MPRPATIQPMMDLQLTDRARSALCSYIDRSGLKSACAAIVRVAKPKGSDPEWELVLYEKERLPQEWNVAVSGININIDPYWHAMLMGKTIDYIDDSFRIE